MQMETLSERLSVEPVPLRPKKTEALPSTPDPDPAPAQQPPAPVKDQTEILLMIADILSRALSGRMLLLLALAGAFSLGIIAMFRGDWRSLAVLAIYAVATIGPIVYLETKKPK